MRVRREEGVCVEVIGMAGNKQAINTITGSSEGEDVIAK